MPVVCSFSISAVRYVTTCFCALAAFGAAAFGGENPENCLIGKEPHRRGYASEIPITLAVAEFNDRAALSEIGKKQRPLTEVEIVAALLVSEPDGRRRTDKEDKQWLASGAKKVLPKGAYIRFQTAQVFSALSGGGRTEVVMWAIWLEFGLNQNLARSGAWDTRVQVVQLPVRYEVLDLK